MLFDPDSEVSAKAFDVVDSWDIAAGVMKREDKEFRSFILPYVTNPDANLRQLVPRSLLEHRATWAKKIAKTMADDPDETVRAEVQKLFTAWKKQSN